MPSSDSYMQRYQSQASNADIPTAAELGRMKRGPVAKLWNTVQALYSLAKDPHAGWWSKALAIAALVYLISPIDAIPDFIPIAGLTDDAGVIIATAAKLASDLRRYMNK